MAEITPVDLRALIAPLRSDEARAQTVRDVAANVTDAAAASRVIATLITDEKQRSIALRALNPAPSFLRKVATAGSLLIVGAAIATALHGTVATLIAGRQAAVPTEPAVAVIDTGVSQHPPLRAPQFINQPPVTTLAAVKADTHLGSYQWVELAEKAGQKGHSAAHLATKEVLTPEEADRSSGAGITLAEYNEHLQRLYATRPESGMRDMFEKGDDWRAFKAKLSKSQLVTLAAGKMQLVEMFNVRDRGPGFEPIPAKFTPLTLPAKVG